jgi:hypothetical protein
MRAQYCRKNIDKVAKACGLERSTIADVKQAAEFCTAVPDLSECSTRAVMALIRTKNEQVKDLAISLAKNALNAKTPTGGKKKQRLSEREIKALIHKADLKIQSKLTKKDEQEEGNQNVPPSATTLGGKLLGDQHQTESVEPALAPEPVGPAGQNVISPVAAVPLPVWYDTHEWSPDICKSGKCPDGKKHYVKYPGRNRMECNCAGVEITQLDDCPVLIRRRKEAAAKSTTATVPAAPVSDTKLVVVEQQQASVTTTTQLEPLTAHDKEVSLKQLLAECLSPEYLQTLDNFAGDWECKTYSAAIEQLIERYLEKLAEESAREKCARVVQPDNNIKRIQDDGATSGILPGKEVAR